MKYTALWFLFCGAAVTAGVVCAFVASPVAVCVCGVIALLSLAMAYRATSMPMRAIRTGMDLLRSQDFASRLCHTGQKNADEVVDLYNAVITNIKSERLKNLEQENFLARLVEVSPMGIAICSLDGEIERTNPAFEKLSSPALLSTLATLQDNEQSTIRPEASQVLRCSRLLFMDRGFRRPFFLVERLTDEIMKAETNIFNKIVRTMGHEVNNTLGGVVSVLETLAVVNSGDSEICAAIDSCRKSCLNLGDFVKGYSDVVKLPDPELKPVDLNGFVSDAMPFLAEMCPDNITLSTDFHPEAPTVMIDSMLIHRVIVNAVKNAVESIGERPGNITVTTAPGSLVITDNGKGISEADAQRIFTPFFSTKHADRGLGLMLISDILRRHHADFSLTTGTDGLTRLSVRFANQ